MLIPIPEKTPVFPMCHEIAEAVAGDGMVLDEAHTRPHGWIRYIDPDDCRNIAYFNYSAPTDVQNGIDLFEFEVDQDEDIWLKKVKTLCYVCDCDDRLLVVIVKNNSFSITIGIIDDTPKLYGHGVHGSMIRYFRIDKQ